MACEEHVDASAFKRNGEDTCAPEAGDVTVTFGKAGAAQPSSVTKTRPKAYFILLPTTFPERRNGLQDPSCSRQSAHSLAGAPGSPQIYSTRNLWIDVLKLRDCKRSVNTGKSKTTHLSDHRHYGRRRAKLRLREPQARCERNVSSQDDFVISLSCIGSPTVAYGCRSTPGPQ